MLTAVLGQCNAFFLSTLLHFGAGGCSNLLALFRCGSAHFFLHRGSLFKRHQLMRGLPILSAVFHAALMFATLRTMLHGVAVLGAMLHGVAATLHALVAIAHIATHVTVHLLRLRVSSSSQTHA